MKYKFKIGDKVRVINPYLWNNGQELVIVLRDCNMKGIIYMTKIGWYFESSLDFAERQLELPFKE